MFAPFASNSWPAVFLLFLQNTQIFFAKMGWLLIPAAIFIATNFSLAVAQEFQKPAVAGKPTVKLVVVISVDQLAQEYLIRFADNLATQAGFFHLVEKSGTRFAECHHRHAFTVTAPGHAVQLTGAYPNINGIVGNNWFERTTGKDRYCVADDTVQVVGNPTGKGMSPRSLLVETLGDSLKRTYGSRSKVIGIAIKDRAAILMSGHRADAAYWMAENHWITSTYYRTDLPASLRVLNEGNTIDRFRSQTWQPLLPLDKYRNLSPENPDKNDWEYPPAGFTSDFPHALPKVGEGTADQFGELVLHSPFGNDQTLEGARAIVEGEGLGQDDIPDLLAINLSSNDYVGHRFGPDSLEVEDMVYRTDQQLLAFTQFLDEKVGAGNWTLALTADHGVAPIVEYAVTQKISAKRIPPSFISAAKDRLEKLLRQQLSLPEGSSVVQKVEESQVYLLRGEKGLEGEQLARAAAIVRDWLLDQPGIAAACTRAELQSGASGKLPTALALACHPQRSGDVLFVSQPYTVSGTRGTTHGTPWRYDTHVPLLFLGNSIAQGKRRTTATSPATLAATLAELLRVPAPAASVEPSVFAEISTQ